MKQRAVTLATALTIAAAGGFAFAQSDATSANNNGVPGVEMNVGSNAKDGGVPGVEMNVGANGDQNNINASSSPSDTSTLGAGPIAQVDRN